MYIYDLPFPINKELCRLLDNEDYWKELAGVHMKYSAFDVNEIEQEANRQKISPTAQLFKRWGQLNHKVEELFILLYRMKHVPALNCLVPIVDSRFKQLLNKHRTKEKNGEEEKQKPKENGSELSVPLPVMLIEKGINSPQHSPAQETFPSDTTSASSRNSTQHDGQPMDDELVRSVAAIPMLKYEDILAVTNNWSANNLLGRGGFGQVYKGEWKLLPVAVKRLSNKDNNNQELIREMCPNQYRHDNILPLYGYSIGGPEACLVYQLMCGGSLDQRLRRRSPHHPLTWPQRWNVALGVTRGLQYLHTMTGTPLIHGDIKPANILLDGCNNAKIADFGLARQGPHADEKTHLKVSRVNGTRPYLPDEYLSSRQLSPAVDVFSFGVVLLEIATACAAFDRTRRTDPLLRDYMHSLARSGVDFATLEDPILRGIGSNPALCREVVALGLTCTHQERRRRPTMLHVYRTLEALPARTNLL
ncbi:serine/threonine-protein kinase pelle [Aricia agestis]|uniref:serine/threonine-protein kinase pelle n=1 Tax=Aricia agestis TaxID=91739 RepID=UPI001C207EC2|nr:serine/threonine-protein kinase pelle [Aricia agestis]